MEAARSKRDDLGHQYNLADMDARSTTSTSLSRRPNAKQAPHHSSKQLQECLNPVRGIRDALRRFASISADVLPYNYTCCESACNKQAKHPRHVMHRCNALHACRQGTEPVNHARHNAAAISAASEANRMRKAQLQQEAEEAGRKPRPRSAASAHSSGYGSAGYMPGCACAHVCASCDASLHAHAISSHCMGSIMGAELRFQTAHPPVL